MSWPAHWLFGASKPINTNRNIRYKQIDLLKNEFEGEITETFKDQSYIITPSKTDIRIFIDIPHEFPNEKAILKIEPPVRHHIIDENMHVIYHLLKDPNADLANIIKEVLAEFEENPPVPLLPPRIPNSNVKTCYPDLTNLTDNQFYDNTNNNSYNIPTIPVVSYKLPDIPNNFPTIDQMEVKDLKELSENESKLLEFISTLEPIKKITQDREELMITLKKQAKANLEFKTVMEEKKNLLLKNIDELNLKRDQLQKIYDKLKNESDKYDPATLCMSLRIAANHSEESSEEIYEKLLQGNIDLERFTKEFVELRKLCHLRRIKEEKLHQTY